MKTYKCPNCKRVKDKDASITSVQCVCGNKSVEVNPETHKPIMEYEEGNDNIGKYKICPNCKNKCRYYIVAENPDKWICTCHDCGILLD